MERTHIDHGHQNGTVMSVHGATYLSSFVEKTKLEILVAADSVGKLYEIKEALQQMGVEEFMESTLLCHGHQRGRTQSYRGVAFATNFVEKVKLEMLVAVDSVEALVAIISKIAKGKGMEDWRIVLTPQMLPIDSTVSQHP
jgi:nitrogen regulatory protein P-II 1